MRKAFVALCCIVFALYFVCASGGLMGGRRDVDLNENEGAANALTYVVRHHNVNINNSISNGEKFVRAVSEVPSAQIQVVQGLKYYFTVILGLTNCTMGSVNEVCTIPQEPENAQTYTCRFTLWSRPWMNSTIVTENCEN